MNDIEKILDQVEKDATNTTVASEDHTDLQEWIGSAKKFLEIARRHNWPVAIAGFAPIAKEGKNGLAAITATHMNPQMIGQTFAPSGVSSLPIAGGLMETILRASGLSKLAEKILK